MTPYVQVAAHQLAAAVLMWTKLLQRKALGALLRHARGKKRRREALAAAIRFRWARFKHPGSWCAAFGVGASDDLVWLDPNMCWPRLVSFHLPTACGPFDPRARSTRLRRVSLLGWRRVAAALAPLRRRLEDLEARVGAHGAHAPCALGSGVD
jgi:hypothetical protein